MALAQNFVFVEIYQDKDEPNTDRGHTLSVMLMLNVHLISFISCAEILSLMHIPTW